MTFEEALRAELITITELNNKVYPLTAPEGVVCPYAVYSKTNETKVRNLSENHTNTILAQYDLDIYHMSYSNMKAIANAVLAKLESMWGRIIATTGPYIQDINIINVIELYESEVNYYRTNIEFEIYYDKE